MNSQPENATVHTGHSSGNGGTISAHQTARRTRFRWAMAVFAFLAAFVTYMDRVNLAITTPAIMKEFHFTKVQMGMMQSTFFLFYALLQIPSGVVTELIGHRRLVPVAIAWWSVFTSSMAFCGKFSHFIVARALFGAGEAPVFPALNSGIAKWFPKQERGRAVAIMWIGDKIGWVLGTILAVFIMVHWGWRAVFISFGLAGLIVAPFYYLILRTHPQDSRHVNQAELEYIAGGQPVAEKKQMPPWADFLRSSQFWAIGGQFITVDFVNYVFIAWVPVYLLEAHHFSLKQMGFVAALPEVGFAVGQIVCGSIADYLIGRRITTSNVRAWIGGLALLSCCSCLYFTAMAEDRWATVAWLTFANTCLGVGSNCAWTTCTEIGGKFAGTVTGWMNFWGNAIGGVSPLIIAWFVTHYGWRAAILATAASGISGTILWSFVRPNNPIKHRYSEPAQAAAVAVK